MKNVLYIVSSPFQFYASLLDFFDNKYENGKIIFIRYKSDKNNYKSIIKKLSLNNLKFDEFYIDEIGMIQKEQVSLLYKIIKKINRLIFVYKIYEIYKNINNYKIKIGDRASFEQVFLAKLLGEKNMEFLGDGASLVFDRDLTIPFSLKSKILFTLLNIPNPNKIKTNNYDFFLRKSNFIETFYKSLPIKDEIWLFGQTSYFIKPAELKNYSKYTQEAINEGKGFDFKYEYFNLLKNIKNRFKDDKIYYFPHRNEIIFDEIKEIFEIADFGYFSEILPLMLGYLPKRVIAISTTIFSFSKINMHIDEKVELVYFPVIKNVDNIYEEYGAKNLLEIID